MDGQRGGFIGSLVGVIGGGLLWLVISGVVIGKPLVWAPPLALGAGLWWGATQAYARRPERHFTIVGVVMLCVIVVCALYLEPVFNAIPTELGGMTTGKVETPMIQLKITLALLAALGAGFVARDLLKET